MPCNFRLFFGSAGSNWPKTCTGVQLLTHFEPSMNRMNALTDLSAREAAGLMARGELRATDYAQALLERADAIASYGALLHLDPEALATAAAELDASPLPTPGTHPLYGVPLAFKNNIVVARMATTAGSP